MEGCGIRLEAGQNLESWLEGQGDNYFPPYNSSKGEKAYPARYEDLKNALIPIHDLVEQGAMAKGACEWMDKTKTVISEIEDKDEQNRLLNELIESDPIVHLNQHGRGHVDKVIDKVSEMLHFFEDGHLTPYEGFFLLCSIQAHDIGNVFGRQEHEQKCKEILLSKGKPSIPDNIERKVIEKLALVHGGACDGDRDTIRHLSSTKNLYERKVRKRLLAALLRFGDELADDKSRADHQGLELGIIRDGSIIYHQYSAALHTVKIDTNTENNRVELFLSYEFDSTLAIQKFKKKGTCLMKYTIELLKWNVKDVHLPQYDGHFKKDTIEGKGVSNGKKRVLHTRVQTGSSAVTGRRQETTSRSGT